MSWFRRQPLSAIAESYSDFTRRSVPRPTPVESLRFVVLDSETTGLDARKDHLLSVAMVPIESGQIQIANIRSWIIFQAKAKLNQATEVHGILPAETAVGRPEAEVVSELLPLLAGAILVGHHLGFDATLLDAAFKRHQRVGLRNPVLDTAELAMQTFEAFGRTPYPGQRPPSLDELCDYCELEPVDRHTAEGDAFTTAELFLIMCSRLRKLRERPLYAKDLPLKRW